MFGSRIILKRMIYMVNLIDFKFHGYIISRSNLTSLISFQYLYISCCLKKNLNYIHILGANKAFIAFPSSHREVRFPIIGPLKLIFPA